MNAARFTTLDGMRGFAAIAVLCYHLHGASPVPMPGGYLAVDFFFALSGFVIAAAYDRRLGHGLTLREFGAHRLIRVYPMYFVGACIALATNGGAIYSLYPLPEFRSHHALFPANGPMWSLFCEVVVSVAFAAIAPRLRRAGLIAIIVVSGSILAEAIVRHGHADLGAFWADATIGMVRTTFSFAVGVAICRARRHLGTRTTSTRLAWLLPPVLLMTMAIAPDLRVARDLFAIFAIFPALVWLGASWMIPESRLFRALGDLSYPLYCIHVPLLGFVEGPAWLVAGYLVGFIAIALWLDRAIDRPVRAWLGRQYDLRYRTLAKGGSAIPA